HRRAWRRLIRKAIVLAEELSPRIELLERWTDDLQDLSRKMNELSRQIDAPARSHAERDERNKRVKELRDLFQIVQSMPEQLSALVAVQSERRRLYQRSRRELAEGNLRLVV